MKLTASTTSQFVRGFLLILLAGFPVSLFSQKQEQPVKIGLLIQELGATAAVNGAELAISKANREGGLNGRPFELVVRSMEGPWGTGSKQAVDLVFDQKVWAMLGSHDGRNAHLVEQVSAKTRVPYMSAWSGDPTLAQAFIPWFFSCVPNNECQASAIFEEIYVNEKLKRVAVVSDNNYDSKSLEKSLLNKIKVTGKKNPMEFTINNPEDGLNGLADSVIKARADCMVIFSGPAVTLKLLERLKERNISLPVFGPVELLDENEGREKDLREFGNLKVVAPYEVKDPLYAAFRVEYFRAYSKYPGPAASFAYDGMRLIISAIRQSGVPDYQKIQKSLMSVNYKGVTGTIRFDDKGNRTGPCKLAYFVNLIP